MSDRFFGGNTLGRTSVAFGTVINHLVPPRRSAYTRLTKLRLTAAGTAHTATILRPLGNTTVAATAAASQTDFTLTANPGPSGNALAANDWIAIRTASDGITRLYRVSSISSLVVTLTGNLTVALAAGDKVWMFGATSDTDPRTGDAHPTFAIPASATTEYSDTVGGVVASVGKDEPILVQSNNATATGALEQTSYSYTHE